MSQDGYDRCVAGNWPSQAVCTGPTDNNKVKQAKRLISAWFVYNESDRLIQLYLQPRTTNGDTEKKNLKRTVCKCKVSSA